MTVSTKNFRKRNAILTCLRQRTDHPSAEMIFNSLKPEIPDLSIGTVYRNLSIFRQQGVATSVATVGGVERFDGTVEPHVHFICNECGCVIDLHQMQTPEALGTEAASCVGGRVDGCQLSFTGVCKECLAHQKPGSETA